MIILLMPGLKTENYDLSLARFLFSAASEIAKASGKEDEAMHWKKY